MQENEKAEFEILVDSFGKGKMVVNGQDISMDVLGFTLQSEPMVPTTLTVALRSGGSVKGTGVVETYRPVDLDKLLANIDPEELEGQAMERLGWGDGSNVTKHIVDILREKAGGGTN